MSAPPSRDPRVRRTRRLLRNALLALAEERDLATITVGEITQRAEINRNTFYRHYRDKDELVAESLNQLFEEITADDRAFADAHGQLRPDLVPQPVIALFRRLAERPALYRRLLTGSGASVFAARLRLFEEGQFLRLWYERGLVAAPGSPPPELRAQVAVSVVHGTVAWWLADEHWAEAETAETMGAWLWQLLQPLWFATVTAAPPQEGR